MARDKNKLTQLGITHVVNVAAGKFQVDTGAKFYRGMPLEYYGIEADDNPFFDLSVYFLPVARYIRSALSVPQGQLLEKEWGWRGVQAGSGVIHFSNTWKVGSFSHPPTPGGSLLTFSEQSIQGGTSPLKLTIIDITKVQCGHQGNHTPQ